MARVYTLSNGGMLVGVNRYNLVHDCYYPYVGFENHNSANTGRHKIGVMADGKFSWLDDGYWRHTASIENDALVGNASSVNEGLGIRLDFTDFVDSKRNMFVRHVKVTNLLEHEQHVKIFFHQVFQISESYRGDTAVYLPDEKAILDYKGNRAIVAAAQHPDGSPQDQYSIGNYGIEGKEGTFRDAEDGELQGNNVEHGYVDSVLRVSLSLAPQESATTKYWLAFGSDNVEAMSLHKEIVARGTNFYLNETRQAWGGWLKTLGINHISDDYKQLATTSALLIKSHIDKRGAILASCDSTMLNYARDYYSYFWPRDGAYALRPLIRLGAIEEPTKLFDLCEGLIGTKGYLEHKYIPDGSLASSWHPRVQEFHSELPIQEDETASIVIEICEAFSRSVDKDYYRRLYKTVIRPACNWMAGFIDVETGLPHASYDLWEQKFAVHSYTVGTVYGALIKAAKMAERLNHNQDVISWNSFAHSIKTKYISVLWDENKQYFVKGVRLHTDGSITKDDTIDLSSLYGLVKFGLLGTDSREFKLSLKTLESKLLNQSPSGGMPRFEYDEYYRSPSPYFGNPWIITTLWLAQIYLMIDRRSEAKELLDWAIEQSSPSGTLPEQINPETSEHLSVEPLTWSHAELLQTIIDFNLGVDH